MLGRALPVALVAALLAAPLAVEAQPTGRIPRVGFLAATARGEFVEAFRQGLRELGYVEGQNVVVEYRFAEGQLDVVPRLAAELAALEVDVIVVPGGVAGNAARRASRTIPIVMVSGDPLITGLV
jgi:putative ABC transport system substrate-binding protein